VISLSLVILAKILIFTKIVPKMTVSIIGDINLSQLLAIPRFKIVLNLDYIFLPASSSASLHQYRLLIPPGTKYVVVGCLAEILGSQPYTPDVGLSKLIQDYTISYFIVLT
jgi:hypothetical protein